MGSMSVWHWVILLAVAALLFGGGGKLSGLMGDAAKGIKAFKNGLSDDEGEVQPSPAQTAAVEQERAGKA